MFKKVDTNMNFVEREKEVESFGKGKIFSKNPSRSIRAISPMSSMTVLLLQTENRISVTWRPEHLRT